MVALKEVLPDDELMMITSQGMMMRIPVGGIRTMGRSTQGVRVIRLRAGDSLQSIARISDEEEDDAGKTSTIAPRSKPTVGNDDDA